MTLEPFMKRQMFDVKVVPVGFSYDRPIEESVFAYELLGVPKPKESTRALLAVLNNTQSNYGRMYLTFGDTISLVDYFGADRTIYCHPNEKTEPVLNIDRLKRIRMLANDIVDQQQRLIVITSFNVIATYFTYRSFINERVNVCQLSAGISRIVDFLRKFNALLSYDNATSLDRDISDALSIHSNVLSVDQCGDLQVVAGKIHVNKDSDLRKLKGHNLSSNTITRAIPLILLQIYVNPIMYWLHAPAFYVLANRTNSGKFQSFIWRIFV